MIRPLFIAVLLLATISFVYAQREYDTWHFGEGAGIRFNGGAPTSIRGPLNTEEGTSVWCDPVTGSVILTTDGTNVYDSTGSILTNGRDIGGGYSSTNSALIVPDPGNTERFYIFCAGDLSNDAIKPDNPVFSYSVVDVSGTGLGVVLQKSTPLVTGTAEKVSGTMHCDGESWWIVAHDTALPKFYVFRVTASGISGPVVSTIGEQYRTVANAQGGPYGMGYIKFSASGKLLALASPFAYRCEVFDFDLFTGEITNARLVDSIDSHYGLSFSPNERFLYTVSWQPSDQTPNQISQYDLQNAFSQYRVGTVSAIKASDNGGIQRGPNGKLYVANHSVLRVINQPDLRGAACAFNGSVSLVGSTQALLGMPTLMDCVFDPNLAEACVPPTAAIAQTIPICVGSCATFSDSSRKRPTQWRWDFENGTPASFNGINPPSICYQTAGAFTVRLIVTNAWGSDTTVRTITVTPPPVVSAIDDLFLCDSARGQLNATGAVRYEWSPTAGLSNQLIADPIVRVFRTTQYVVRGWDAIGCWDEDTVMVYARLRPYPVARFATSSFVGLAGSSGNVSIVKTNDESLSDCTLTIQIPHAAFLVDRIERGTVLSDVMTAVDVREITIHADLSTDTVAKLHGTLLLYGTEEYITTRTSTVDTCIDIVVEPGMVYSDACFVDGRIVREGDNPLQIIRVARESNTIDIIAEPRSEYELSLWTLQGELIGQRSGIVRSPMQSIEFDTEFPQMMFVRLRSGEVFVTKGVAITD